MSTLSPTRVTTAGLEATIDLGRRLAPLLRAGDIVLLRGPLGAGKTALVRGVVAGLDPVVGDLVTSPSYVVAGEYPTRPRVIHLDLYRLSTVAEVVALGHEELIYRDDGIALVEWPELLEPLLEPDDPVLTITLAHGAGPDDRSFAGASADPRLAQAFARAAAPLSGGPDSERREA
jgi:tRNA threonylcarbamoyladenosine biosynthesis protein TsaE